MNPVYLDLGDDAPGAEGDVIAAGTAYVAHVGHHRRGGGGRGAGMRP